jgi:hypothetical protein
MSASDPRVHFGLGTTTHAEEIVIRWPGGHVDTLRNVPADQQLTVIEGRPPAQYSKSDRIKVESLLPRKRERSENAKRAGLP